MLVYACTGNNAGNWICLNYNMIIGILFERFQVPRFDLVSTIEFFYDSYRIGLVYVCAFLTFKHVFTYLLLWFIPESTYKLIIKSFFNSVFPSNWKACKVLLIPKKSLHCDYKDLRPISILSKVLEHVMRLYSEIWTFSHYAIWVSQLITAIPQLWRIWRM